MRLIDADVMIKDLQAMQRQFDAIAIDGMIRGIEKQPTIEAEPVRNGKWGVEEIVGYDGVHPVYATACSVCCSYTKIYKAKWCPNCGAKMDLK